MRGYCSREFIRDYLRREIDGTVVETKREAVKGRKNDSEDSETSRNFIRTYSFF